MPYAWHVERQANGADGYGDDNFLKPEWDGRKEILEELIDAFNITCMSAERNGGCVPELGMMARLFSTVSGEDRPLLVYVSHPYSDNPQKRVAEVQAIAQEVMERGHIPIVPPAMFHDFDQGNSSLGYDTFLEAALELLAICDLVLFSGCSPGAGLEWTLAKRIGKPVIYALEDVPWRSWAFRLLKTLDS